MQFVFAGLMIVMLVAFIFASGWALNHIINLVVVKKSPTATFFLILISIVAMWFITGGFYV